MKFSRNIFSNVLITEWRWGDSNPWPPACKAGALPTELHPQILRIRLGFPYTFGSLFFYPFLYSRKSWAWEDSNFRPHAYQACALTGWATSPYRLSAFQASIRFLWQPLFIWSSIPPSYLSDTVILHGCFIFFNAGSHLFFHTVSSAVPSAAYGLTIVFGMGTGVTHKRITTSKYLTVLLTA